MALLFRVCKVAYRYQPIFKIIAYNLYRIPLLTTLVFNFLHCKYQHHYVSFANNIL